MNTRRRRLTYLAFLTLIIAVALTFTSCGAMLSGVLVGIMGNSVEESTEESVEVYPDASFPVEEWNDKLPDEYIQNDITINGEHGDVAYAASAGLRSAVSIYCSFSDNSFGSSQYYTTGSGVIYKINADGDAFIITNFHVVYDKDSNTKNGISADISLFLYGMEVNSAGTLNEQYAIPATYVGGSLNYDIAILRVDNNPILRDAYARGAAAAVKIANSDFVFPGETSIAIGNPATSDIRGISVTTGVVSVESEYITMMAADDSKLVSFRVIRTDTPVNPGNSGGGLYNANGELIGIVNAKSGLTSVENIGYAIPSNVARAIGDNIIDYCYGKSCESVMRGMLGVSVNVLDYTTEYDTEIGMLIRRETIGISSVEVGKLADGVLKVGDVVTGLTIVDGAGSTKDVDVYRMHHLIDSMLDVRVNCVVYLSVTRDGADISVTMPITADCLEAY